MYRGLALFSLALLLLAGATTVRANEGVEGADRALRAHAESDQEALTQVVSSKHGDVWVVVERLLARGSPDVAAVLVDRASAEEARALKAYMETRRAQPVDKNVFTTLDGIHDLRRSGNGDGARAALAAARLPTDGVAGVLHLTHRMYLLKSPQEALQAGTAAAQAAGAIGWVRRQEHLERTCLQLTHKTKQHARTIEIGVRVLAEAGDDPPRKLSLFVHQRLARAYRATGRAQKAAESARIAARSASTPLARRDTLRFLFIVERDNAPLHEVREWLLALRRLEVELGNSDGVAATNVKLATTDALSGRWASAIEHVTRGLAWFDEHGKPWQRRGAHLSASAVALELLDGERALRHVAVAREAGKATQLDDTPLFTMEAAARFLMEDYAGSEKAYRVVLSRADRVTKHVLRSTWINLASVLTMAGRLDAASEALTAAQAISMDDVGLQIRWLAARSLHALAAGNIERAEESAQEARRLAAAHGRPRWSSVIEARLASAALARGDGERALVHARPAVEQIVRRSAALPARLGAQYRAELRNTFGLAIEAALAADDMAVLFTTAERARAVALRHRLGGADAMIDMLEPALRKRELALRAQETRVVRRFRKAAAEKDQASVNHARRDLSEVREQLDRHREHMHVRQGAAAQLVDPQVDTLAATQARLADDEAQVHFAHGRQEVIGLVITRTDVRALNMGTQSAFDALSDDLTLEDPDSPWREAWQALEQRVVAQLALPSRITRLTIVPAGRLASLPFAALWPTKAVTLVPSATIGRLLGAASGPARGTLAIGDPASAEGPRLPGAAQEAARVGDTTLTDTRATEAGVRDALATRKRWKVVHFGCHAQIDAAHPLRSSLGLAPAGEDDGLWTVAEILGTRVPAELVVLAACSSAQGRTFEQEGRVGFVHAFFVAGATRVLASLWPVDDRATAALFQRFHAALSDGATPAEALRSAQLSMRQRKAWAHPAYWAGWQLWGPH